MADPAAKRRFGRVGLDVTISGLGGGPLGNLFTAITEDEATDLISSAWEAGVRLFDTAPGYGNGLSEMRIGRVLESWPRAQAVISTKVGQTLTPGDPGSTGGWVEPAPNLATFDYGYDAALRQLESSLERLRTDHVEIVYIHDVDVAHHGEEQPARFAEAMGGAYHALIRLREEGVIKAIGVGVNEIDVCVAAAQQGDFDCFLLAGRYTLLEQDALDDLLPLCEDRGIAIAMGGVFNSGILAKGSGEGARYNYRPAAAEVARRVEAIESICRRFEVPLGAAAVQFPLAHPAVATVLLGARRREQQEGNLDFLSCDIPDALWDALKSERLLRPDAPTPTTSPGAFTSSDV